MTTVAAPNGDETHIRAIVFKDGDMYVAQCLEYDIAAQAKDINALIARLDLTIEAEFAACHDADLEPREAISPAPNYYHDLWTKRSVTLDRVNVATPGGGLSISMALARAA